jgi:hypothetical protein
MRAGPSAPAPAGAPAAAEPLAVRPEIDLARALAGLGFDPQGRELAGFAADMLTKLTAALSAWRIDHPDGGFVLLAIDEKFECELGRIFENSPTRGYLAQALASLVLGRAAGMLVPGTAAHGCSPLVAPPKPVRDALAGLGLRFTEPGGFTRALAVLTPMPYRGGCEVCLLSKDCPKKRGGLTSRITP